MSLLIRPVETSLCMQGASRAGIVDQMSVLLTAASVLKQGRQGDDSDLRRDIPHDAEDAEEVREEGVDVPLSTDVDVEFSEEDKELACEVGGNGIGVKPVRCVLKV